jgi:hypothetical protein
LGATALFFLPILLAISGCLLLGSAAKVTKMSQQIAACRAILHPRQTALSDFECADAESEGVRISNGVNCCGLRAGISFSSDCNDEHLCG